jgi:hypothetical protein
VVVTAQGGSSRDNVFTFWIDSLVRWQGGRSVEDGAKQVEQALITASASWQKKFEKKARKNVDGA